MPVALSATGMSKAFAGVRALEDVSVTFRAGVVTGLLGENGAGKSTLIRVCSGEMQPDSGELRLGSGPPVTLSNPLMAMRAGVVVVHQEPQLVTELTVADNLFLYRLGDRSAFRSANRRDTVRQAGELLERLGMSEYLPVPSVQCRTLSAAERQMVDIVRALSMDPKVLFLDEPNSSLTHWETERLFRVIARMRDSGVAVVLVSHRLAEVYEIVDQLVVLRDGRHIAEGTPEAIDQAHAIRLMAGEQKTAAARDAAVDRVVMRDGPAAIQLDDCTGPGFSGVSLAVHPGEIVGMAGLVGAGRTEIAQSVIGLTKMTHGVVKIDGRQRHLRNPRDAQRKGVSYVAEERRAEIFAAQDVGFNLTVRVLERLGPIGTVSGRARTALAKKLSSRYGIRAASVAAPIMSLSGGNQQKVILARALATGPKVLILDEPTRGVDVGTKAEIYRTLRELAHEGGLAVWFISSEMEEVLELADRILVVRHGRIVRDAPNTADPRPVVAAAMGVAESGS